MPVPEAKGRDVNVTAAAPEYLSVGGHTLGDLPARVCWNGTPRAPARGKRAKRGGGAQKLLTPRTPELGVMHGAEEVPEPKGHRNHLR